MGEEGFENAGAKDSLFKSYQKAFLSSQGQNVC